MKAGVRVPVTVKCRLGVDDQDTEESLDRFVDAVIAAGADALIVHARKAWLKGLSPRENREVPPLDYPRVYRLKRRLGSFPVVINGGIRSLDEAESHLTHVDGVMLGRAAYDTPALLIDVDPRLFGTPAPATSAHEAVEALMPYIARQMQRGTRLHDITRHLLGLFRAVPGARAFRRYLATEAVKRDAGIGVLRQALALVLDSSRAGAQTEAA
jgi:tRNA-dihydrouridine synthase A